MQSYINIHTINMFTYFLLRKKTLMRFKAGSRDLSDSYVLYSYNIVVRSFFRWPPDFNIFRHAVTSVWHAQSRKSTNKPRSPTLRCKTRLQIFLENMNIYLQYNRIWMQCFKSLRSPRIIQNIFATIYDLIIVYFKTILVRT